MGVDSGRVSSLLVCISVHSPVDYVLFDFLHKVNCHQLGLFFFYVQFDGRMDFIVVYLKRGELNCWYFIPRMSSEGSPEAVSHFCPCFRRIFFTVMEQVFYGSG
jgi:hypothetical protein